MTQTTTIDGVSRTSVVKRISCEWSESAYLGEIGQGTLAIHDDAGTISVVGHKTIITEQSASTPARIFTGFVGQKKFSRTAGDDLVYTAGASRVITVTTKDANDLLTRYIITGSDGNRSAETVAARVSWLLASSYVSVNDYGNVADASAFGMDATDYRGQRAGDVLAACAKKAGYNYYVRWSVANSGFELVFRDDNASTDDTSTISIANDGTANGTTIFAPFQDAELTEDPEDVYSGVYVGYAKGNVYRTRAATATAFVERDGVADDSGIKTAASAQDAGDRFLWESHLEENGLTLTIRMRAAYVGLVQAGQRVSVTMTHLATQGYDSATYFRVLRRRVRQPLDTDNDYDVTLDLSPQEEAQPIPPGIIQIAVRSTGAGGGIATFPNAVTVGSLLVWMGCRRGSTTGNPYPNPPNTDVAQPRWGAGAWTDATPSDVRVRWDDPRAYEEGMRLYWKIADSTSNTSGIDEYCAGVCWEISAPATMAGATIVTKDLQTTSTTHAIGSLGTPSAGKVAILMLGLGAVVSASPANVAINPGVWVRDFHADGFQHVWDSDTNSVGFNTPAAPETWFGHTTATGAALAATVTDSYSHYWGGIALVLP